MPVGREEVVVVIFRMVLIISLQDVGSIEPSSIALTCLVGSRNALGKPNRLCEHAQLVRIVVLLNALNLDLQLHLCRCHLDLTAGPRTARTLESDLLGFDVDLRRKKGHQNARAGI